jgi:hypothetical protein
LPARDVTDDQLAIHLPLPEEPRRFLEECFGLERVVTEHLQRLTLGVCDGNDVGKDEFTLFIQTNVATEALASIRPLLPDGLVRPGAYASIRTTSDQEQTVERVELTDHPAHAVEHTHDRPLAPLGFGVYVAGATATNERFQESIRAARQRLPHAGARGPNDASLVVIWSIGGRFGPPPAGRERVQIEDRSQRLLGVTVPVPDIERTTAEGDRLIALALARVIEECHELLARRKLGWDLVAVQRAVGEASRQP